MPRRSRRLATLVVAWVAVLAPSAHAISASTIRARLAHDSAKLGRFSGIDVKDLTSGTVLYTKRPDSAFSPASNEKLYTTSVALRKFGADMTLTTKVVAAAAPTDPARIDGNLFLVGGGDPALDDEDLGRLATQLVAAGLKKVTGAVAGDESLFDGRRGSYDSHYAPDTDVEGQLSALEIDHGATDAVSPAHNAAALLQAQLTKMGVTFGKQATVGVAPSPASEPLAFVQSLPISALIALTNQPSDNFYAETLLKDLGAYEGTGGTTPAGVTVVQDELAPIGVKPIVVDGSGLSRTDRTSTRMIVMLLQSMFDRPDFPAWRASLAVAGKSGTLIHRMRGTPAAGRCRGKTGTLSNVSALSGYCTVANGDTLAFSFLENDVPYTAKAVEDDMAESIARYTP